MSKKNDMNDSYIPSFGCIGSNGEYFHELDRGEYFDDSFDLDCKEKPTADYIQNGAIIKDAESKKDIIKYLRQIDVAERFVRNCECEYDFNNIINALERLCSYDYELEHDEFTKSIISKIYEENSDDYYIMYGENDLKHLEDVFHKSQAKRSR